MSTNKTEKPTPKKLKDAGLKGQSFKSKDLITTCLILTGGEFILHSSLFSGFAPDMIKIISSGFTLAPQEYARAVFIGALQLLLPVILLCILASALPSLLQTGFRLATKALKINFAALNPVNGVKKLFSLRALKDIVKCCLYLCSFIVAGKIFWEQKKGLLLSQLHASPRQLLIIWADLFHTLIMLCFVCLLVILLLDMVAEYLLHIKDLKMDKREVKLEHREQEGNPEIKSKRRSMHQELLSEQLKSDIENSKVIIANPTHIAIGIFQNPEICLIPFISVKESNQRALAVRAWAEKCGVPVVEDIRLARKIYKTHERYSFVQFDELEEVLRLLLWLEEVEKAWSKEISHGQQQDERSEEVSHERQD
ncbi:EscU/YscU/HrcU family type III secretion system export apparatus switch protein [[Erwinia] mediterraneensis]|uniref:EscU/YscU/HrcU family type III secretion system export apparatus switch protein n=1 Tax=[Erwinia] mediterraneensis TaxID=2161819 RepID=UPI00102F661E|nr:EscU/YscU/HrcU family type III secretion system export apparatus switch protein [[Erwinia] mediterraneensis]